MKIEDWEQSNFLRYGNSFVLVSRPQLFKRWINLCPVDSAIDIPNTYPLANLYLSSGSHYPSFEKPGLWTLPLPQIYVLDIVYSRRMSNLGRK